MRSTILVSALAAAALLSGGSAALAQEDQRPAPCAEALAQFNDARGAYEAAVAADEAADAALNASDALSARERDLAAAKSAAQAGGVAYAYQTQATVDSLVAEQAELEALDSRTVAQDERLAQIETRVPLIRAVIDAQAKRDTAAEAAQKAGDPVALTDKAAETNATELGKVRDQAGVHAETVCGAAPDDLPTVTPTPSAPPAAPVSPSVKPGGSYPKGGIETGGGATA